MQEDDNRDFDLLVRSMFEDAEEEVPSRIWDAVSSRMDVPARKPAIVWWRRAAVSAAAIAAIASGIFLGLHDSTLPNTDGALEVVQQAPTVSPLAELLPSSQDETQSEVIPETIVRKGVTAKRQEIARSLEAEDVTDVGPVKVETSEEPLETPVPAESAEAPETEVDEDSAEAMEILETVDGTALQDDPFVSGESWDEVPQRGGRFSFSAGGNAQTNTVSGGEVAVRPFMAPGAVTVPDKTTVKEQGKSTFGIPVSVGLGVSYRFNPRWSVGLGLNATRPSRTFAGKYIEIAEDGTLARTVTGDIDQTLLYVGVPLNVYFDILKSNAVRFYTYGGGTVEKGLSNRYTIHDKSSDIHFKGEFDGLQFSAGLGMGVELKLVGGLGIYVDPSLRYYFDCSQPTSIRTEEPLMMTMDIGFRFNFK